jgi:hypothetical protein
LDQGLPALWQGKGSMPSTVSVQVRVILLAAVQIRLIQSIRAVLRKVAYGWLKRQLLVRPVNQFK